MRSTIKRMLNCGFDIEQGYCTVAVTNSPTPDKSISKPSGKSSGNSQPADRPVVTLLVRGAVLGVGAIAGIVTGLAIAFVRPDLVWQPSFNFLNYKKQQFTLSSEALFDVDKASIRPESFRLLDEVAAQLPLDKGKRVRINGHVDATTGNALTLSYLRAASVRDYLARLRGEQNYYWMVIGYGATRPLASSAGEGNSKSNRRIEIFVDD
ncbi:OmpA family protein [Pseudanabaena sp. ABRG5-3]|uniref:OmpA family protein n=1 Tax=Pseudanabaena sp. ABRG5-3 TaxID=685565 RepID=UPI001CEDFF4E|nr:OmpA family protein [Pseudanabaena sp. ABRG5-3]